MSVTQTATSTLVPEQWLVLNQAHRERAQHFTSGWRSRQQSGERHPVEDFLFEYYPLRPSLLERWHPGLGVVLARPDAAQTNQAALAEYEQRAAWRWYREIELPGDQAGSGMGRGLVLDESAMLTDRGPGIGQVHNLLEQTAKRPALFGCFGLHEWAMVYQQPDAERRHSLPLRLSPAETDAVVADHPLRCTHFDAYRFFTPQARPLNGLELSRELQLQVEQPGCLHANMDLYRAAIKLGPLVPGELLLDCFELARDIRYLDMQASPYDVSSLGLAPVAIETATGRAEYVQAQRGFAERAQTLRTLLLQLRSPAWN